jgi:iron(III) transport system substrate-binding protein
VAHRSPDGTWVGTSGRAHVVFYNTDQLTAADLPDSILGFTDPAWRRRIGWDPTSRSLQDVITELTQRGGEDAARQWLQGIQANKPAANPRRHADHQRRCRGQNHPGRLRQPLLPQLPARRRRRHQRRRQVLPRRHPGALLNVAGVGIIKGTNKQAAANAFVDFMLSQTVQRYLATDAYEIQLIQGVQPPDGTPTAAKLIVARLNVQQFEELTPARQLLTDTRIIG